MNTAESNPLIAQTIPKSPTSNSKGVAFEKSIFQSDWPLVVMIPRIDNPPMTAIATHNINRYRKIFFAIFNTSIISFKNRQRSINILIL